MTVLKQTIVYIWIAIRIRTYNMNGVTHVMNFKINASLSIYNLEIGLVPYVRRLHQEITSLRDLRVYSYSY